MQHSFDHQRNDSTCLKSFLKRVQKQKGKFTLVIQYNKQVNKGRNFVLSFLFFVKYFRDLPNSFTSPFCPLPSPHAVEKYYDSAFREKHKQNHDSLLNQNYRKLLENKKRPKVAKQNCAHTIYSDDQSVQHIYCIRCSVWCASF